MTDNQTPWNTKPLKLPKVQGLSPLQKPKYTKNDLREYGKRCALAALDEAAELCEFERLANPTGAAQIAYDQGLEFCGAGIRRYLALTKEQVVIK